MLISSKKRLYAVITDLSDKAETIIKVNKGRWEIEESFRIMKTEFEAKSVHLSREDRIKAHFLICYLAIMIFKIMEQKMEEIRKHFTAHEIITTLRKYEVIDVESFYIGAMEGKATKALEKTFGLIESMLAMSKASCRKLISKSKREK